MLSGKDLARIVLVTLAVAIGQTVAGLPAAVAGCWAQAALVNDASASQAATNPLEEGFSGHVRVTDLDVQEALREISLRSPTFRGMLDRLNRSNLIVWIIPAVTTNAPTFRRIHGFIGQVTLRGGTRYVRIVLQPGLRLDLLTHILPHELQHAVEIADAPDVVDKRSLEELYRRIGYPNGGAYDTDAALRASWDVLKEMSEHGRRHAPAATE